MKVDAIRTLAIFGALAIFWLLLLIALIAFWRNRRKKQVATSGDDSADPASTPTSTAESVRIRIKPLIDPEACLTTTLFQQSQTPSASANSVNPLSTPRRPAITWTGTPSEYQASKKQLEVPQSNVGGDRSIRDRSPLTEWRMTDESESSGRNTRLEMTLVFVAGSSQLIIYFHRIVNLPLRGGKQYATYVKISLCSQSKRTLRSSVAPKSLNPNYDQVFTFTDVTAEVVNASSLRVDVKCRPPLTGSVTLGSWSRSLGRLHLDDGQPRAFTAPVNISGDTDSEASLAPRHSIAELGQMLISLQYQSDASRLKVFIRKAQVPSACRSARNLKAFEAEYLVVVNLSVRHGSAEVKETKAVRGKTPTWNQAFLFNVAPEQMELCWMQLTLIKRPFGRHQTAVGHVTLGIQSTPEGEQHWRAAINPRDFEVTQWHRLTRR